MGGALDKTGIHVEKLVFLPFQIYSGVWTVIAKAVKLSVFMDDENLACFAFPRHAEGFATWIRNITGLAKDNRVWFHNVVFRLFQLVGPGFRLWLYAHGLV